MTKVENSIVHYICTSFYGLYIHLILYGTSVDYIRGFNFQKAIASCLIYAYLLLLSMTYSSGMSVLGCIHSTVIILSHSTYLDTATYGLLVMLLPDASYPLKS